MFSPFKRLLKDQISAKIPSFISISFFVINKSGDRNVSRGTDVTGEESVTTSDNESVGGECPRDGMIEKGQEKAGRTQEKTDELLAVSR